MSGTTGARNDDLEAALNGRRRILEQEVGRTVCRNDANLTGHAQRLERIARVTHRLPVGPGTHDNADINIHCKILSFSSINGRDA
jgi:hypothetical protein